jgi:hypothetical protein
MHLSKCPRREIAAEKENRVFWRVKMQDELDLAASATDPADAVSHRNRAREFEDFANQESPPDPPLDPDLA